jgi:outer membrane protein X
MKKLMMIAMMVLASTAMFAQKGATYVGIQANYGLHKDYKNFGVGAKAQYEFLENVRAEASFNYFFKKDCVSMWDINLNAHYVFRVGSVGIYPLAGICVLGAKPEHGDTETKLGFNAGAGVEFPLSETIKLNVEGKYQYVKHFDRPVISAGIAFAL